MARSYQQFLTSLSTDELLVLQRAKLGEVARRGPTMSRSWVNERGAEIRLLRAEIRLRGTQLSLDALYEAERLERA